MTETVSLYNINNDNLLRGLRRSLTDYTACEFVCRKNVIRLMELTNRTVKRSALKKIRLTNVYN